MEIEDVDVLVIGSGTAGSNAARQAAQEGATRVVMVHQPELINTCIEEGCMPSKSILAGAHAHLPLADIIADRDAHIARLLKALTDGFETGAFSVVVGTATFIDETTISAQTESGVHHYNAKAVVIASGSKPIIPNIPGLDTLDDELLVSDDVVAKRAQLTKVPKRILTIGGGPIGLELSTFFYDLGATVDVLQRSTALGLFDPEFGEERVRASLDDKSFPIHLNAKLLKVQRTADGVLCTIDAAGKTTESLYDTILLAIGRKPNLAALGLEHTRIALDAHGNVIHDAYMETTQPGVFIAGDVTGHHQILHFAAEMGKIAGYNTQHNKEKREMDYDKHMLAISFDQFPSALIGLTEKEATAQNIETVTATRAFNSIGLGILKRQEYGMWKVIAEKTTGRILGSQILGPDSAGELIQILVPLIANKNTAADIIAMTWYHPTYAEILLSIARDIEHIRKDN